MSEEHCVILGASHAAAQLAPSLRQQGWKGRITIVGDEPFLPYHRPPLSKGFLAGEQSFEDILIRKPALYEKADIHFTLGALVKAIHRENKRVELDNGEYIAYDKLALTVGSRVRQLNVPGVGLHGVFYLRKIGDVEKIKGFVGAKKKAVVIGGGYIGLETAAVLNKLGMQVSVLEAMPRILQRVTAAEVSAFFTRVHTEEGVSIVTNTAVTAIEGDQYVRAVNCDDGSQHEADLVIIGVGIMPNVELAQAAGIDVNNGIIVDEHARTSDGDIVAAGDCTSHFSSLYDRWVRLESVQNASEQARVAAATICGDLRAYDAIPWFWSDQYDLKLQIAGLSLDHDDVVIRGDIVNSRTFAVFYLKKGKVIAVDAVNRPREFMFGKRLIAADRHIDNKLLSDDKVPIMALLQS